MKSNSRHRCVENLVEIEKNFNDTTGSIFSTAFRKEKEKKEKHSSPLRSLLFPN